MTIKKITVPDLGEASEVEVIELLVSVGQKVQENDSLLVLESDKAAMEIPAPFSGTVNEISVNLGDQVTTDSEILTLETNSAEEEASESDSPGKSESEKSEDTEHRKEDSYDQNLSTTLDKVEQVTVEVPDLGTDEEVDVIEIHVQVGGQVESDDSLVTLESDKAAMEVPSPSSGKLMELLIQVGDKVKTGSKIATIEQIVKVSNETSSAQAPTAKDSSVDLSPEESNTEITSKAISKKQSSSESDKAETNFTSPANSVYAGPAAPQTPGPRRARGAPRGRGAGRRRAARRRRRRHASR